jgi:hypothetical protein
MTMTMVVVIVVYSVEWIRIGFSGGHLETLFSVQHGEFLVADNNIQYFLGAMRTLDLATELGFLIHYYYYYYYFITIVTIYLLLLLLMMMMVRPLQRLVTKL